MRKEAAMIRKYETKKYIDKGKTRTKRSNIRKSQKMSSMRKEIQE